MYTILNNNINAGKTSKFWSGNVYLNISNLNNAINGVINIKINVGIIPKHEYKSKVIYSNTVFVKISTINNLNIKSIFKL
jgi:hypothetical protein